MALEKAVSFDLILILASDKVQMPDIASSSQYLEINIPTCNYCIIFSENNHWLRFYFTTDWVTENNTNYCLFINTFDRWTIYWLYKVRWKWKSLFFRPYLHAALMNWKVETLPPNVKIRFDFTGKISLHNIIIFVI